MTTVDEFKEKLRERIKESLPENTVVIIGLPQMLEGNREKGSPRRVRGKLGQTGRDVTHYPPCDFLSR